MSSAAATAAGTDDRVYRAVAAGASVEDVRRAIERCRSSAAVNQPGRDGATPLRAARQLRRDDLVCVLLENGAEARDGDWFVAVNWCVYRNDLAGLRRLLEHGAWLDIVRIDGRTHLMEACWHARARPDRREITLEIFCRSSTETRRAVMLYGSSAVDVIIAPHLAAPLEPWHVQLIGELLAAGAPVLPDNADLVLPITAAHAARREAELAALPPLAHDWRAHETFVGLSLDVRELREAELMVAERRARLDALERELGGGTDSSSSEDESESESDEDDEAAGSGGGGGGGGE